MVGLGSIGGVGGVALVYFCHIVKVDFGDLKIVVTGANAGGQKV